MHRSAALCVMGSRQIKVCVVVRSSDHLFFGSQMSHEEHKPEEKDLVQSGFRFPTPDNAARRSLRMGPRDVAKLEVSGSTVRINFACEPMLAAWNEWVMTLPEKGFVYCIGTKTIWPVSVIDADGIIKFYCNKGCFRCEVPDDKRGWLDVVAFYSKEPIERP